MGCFLTNSSLGKKLVMSITGCFLVLFILFHMSMNIVAIFSPEAYNTVCAFLGANWYALVGTLVLFAGIRERLELEDVPKAVQGVPVALITAGILAIAFMGFSGLV